MTEACKCEDRRAETFRAFVQMPVILHNETVEIVEAVIDLPWFYHPFEGQWMYHDIFHGSMPLGPILYDGDRKSLVLTTAGAAYDYTVTLEEWLQGRTPWYKAEKPFVTTRKSHGVSGDSDDEEGAFTDE